jgi:hypothetical protein
LSDQYCQKVSCGNNPNCYKCEWKSCDKVASKVTILSRVPSVGNNITINVIVQCADWTYSPTKDFNMSLFIDGKYWSECEINDKRLSKDLGWNIDEQDMGHGCKCCGGESSNKKWKCDTEGYCKHKDYDITVFSNTSQNLLNITFTCKLPSNLSPGNHYLSVYSTVYSKPIQLKPVTTTFVVIGNGFLIIKKIISILTFPLRILIPF